MQMHGDISCENPKAFMVFAWDFAGVWQFMSALYLTSAGFSDRAMHTLPTTLGNLLHALTCGLEQELRATPSSFVLSLAVPLGCVLAAMQLGTMQLGPTEC